MIFAIFVMILPKVIAYVADNSRQKGSKNARSIQIMFQNVFKVALTQSYSVEYFVVSITQLWHFC